MASIPKRMSPVWYVETLFLTDARLSLESVPKIGDKRQGIRCHARRVQKRSRGKEPP